MGIEILEAQFHPDGSVFWRGRFTLSNGAVSEQHFHLRKEVPRDADDKPIRDYTPEARAALAAGDAVRAVQLDAARALAELEAACTNPPAGPVDLMPHLGSGGPSPPPAGGAPPSPAPAPTAPSSPASPEPPELARSGPPVVPPRAARRHWAWLLAVLLLTLAGGLFGTYRGRRAPTKLGREDDTSRTVPVTAAAP